MLDYIYIFSFKNNEDPDHLSSKVKSVEQDQHCLSCTR